MFIFWKHNTSFAVSRIFVPAILLILGRVDSLGGWLFCKLDLLFIYMIITINNLLLNSWIIWIYLRSAISILIRQKVRRLIIWLYLLLPLLLLELFVSILLLNLVLSLILGSKLNLAAILNDVLWLHVEILAGQSASCSPIYRCLTSVLKLRSALLILLTLVQLLHLLKVLKLI